MKKPIQKEKCNKCHGYGVYQEYVNGRVVRRFCSCPQGERKELQYLATLASAHLPWYGVQF